MSAAYSENRDKQQQQQVVLAVGHGVTSAIAATAIGALAAMIGSIVLALTLAIITFVKRRRAKKALIWGGYPAYPPSRAIEQMAGSHAMNMARL